MMDKVAAYKQIALRRGRRPFLPPAPCPNVLNVTKTWRISRSQDVTRRTQCLPGRRLAYWLCEARDDSGLLCIMLASLLLSQVHIRSSFRL
ncbi:hypothetical protein K469DRAFT_721201 [Zopfia rhizophila CBS 207.26]|uniref:Uncharacterized protein n=1 Tax=Zopfia rhizophila CBS 207.26 TaxID=1314779 RepID=A0A6A6DFD4_9PEZI|nr:hypothetical protein K469DRAFT_721201 [Zopfia rhizophila CBS 207.26]